MKKLWIFISLLLLTVAPVSVYANEDNQGTYSVQAVLPDNQVSEATYFDIEMEVGQEQVLEVTLSNPTDQPIIVLGEAHPGVTNENGLISYFGNNEATSSTQEFTFESVVELVENEITIPANSNAIAKIKVKAPKDTFDGRILGGLYFKLAPSEVEGEEGFSITNEYSYIIGLNIVEKGNESKIEPELVLNEVVEEEFYSQPGIRLSYENLTPVMIPNLVYKAVVYPADDSATELETFEIQDFDIAPSYHFSVPFEFANEDFEPGDYRVKVSLENEKFSWKFEETFSITK